MKMAVPMTLKYRCTSAARLAFRCAPTLDSSAVTQVPIFWPMMMGTAALQPTAPVAASACRMPTLAEDD